MVEVTVAKWGDTLAVRLPREIVQAARLQDGERVEIAAQDGGILIRRTDRDAELAKLFEGKTPQEWHEAYSAAFDWGPDKGRSPPASSCPQALP